MFRIAICDDDKIVCANLEELIGQVGEENHYRFEIDLYFTGESLCQRLESGEEYDILFLDIELFTMTGIEIGHRIREKNDNDEMQIVYISGKTDYALELFQTRPLDFFVKPFIKSKVEKALLTAIKLFRLKTRYLTFSANRQTIRIPILTVLYFESDGKKIRVFTKDSQYEFYGSLERIKKQLTEKDFLEIHKSFIINYHHVQEYSSDRVVMLNGKNLPISRSRKKDVQTWLLSRKEDDIVVG